MHLFALTSNTYECFTMFTNKKNWNILFFFFGPNQLYLYERGEVKHSEKQPRAFLRYQWRWKNEILLCYYITWLTRWGLWTSHATQLGGWGGLTGEHPEHWLGRPGRMGWWVLHQRGWGGWVSSFGVCDWRLA